MQRKILMICRRRFLNKISELLFLYIKSYFLMHESQTSNLNKFRIFKISNKGSLLCPPRRRSVITGKRFCRLLVRRNCRQLLKPFQRYHCSDFLYNFEKKKEKTTRYKPGVEVSQILKREEAIASKQ